MLPERARRRDRFGNLGPVRVLQVVSSAARSGGEGHVRTLSLALRDRGHEVTIVCPTSEWMGEGLDGIEVVQTDFRARLGLDAHSVLARLHSTYRYDVIHAHLSRAGYVSTLAGGIHRVPVLLSVHTETREPLYRLAARGRNRLIAVSGYIRDVLVSQGVAPSRILIVPHGTPLADAPPSSAPGGVPQGKRILSLVGRLAPEKGQLVAIQALPAIVARHPDAHLVCVGRDVDGFQALLESEAERLGVGRCVSFIPHLDEVAGLLDASEMALLPSVIESFGLVVLEAMARGKAVVVSPAGALPELVQDGVTGHIVPNEPQRWSEAVCRLLADPDLSSCMGRRAQQRVQSEFSLGAMAEGTEMAYSSAMDGKP